MLLLLVAEEHDRGANLLHGAAVMQSRATASVPDERTRAAFLAARASYDMTRHMESGTSQAAAVTPELINRFGITGPMDECSGSASTAWSSPAS